MSSSVIVLAGAGHANIQCLKMMAMRPLEGVSVILISDGDVAPYSGMLPGYMMGLYSEEEIHFNLWKLASQSGFLFIRDRVTKIDPQNKLVSFASGRAPILYDVLSLNIGITPKNISPDIDSLNIIKLKPISLLLSKWNHFLKGIDSLPTQNIAVIGGGPAGIETTVALATQVNIKKRNDRITLIHSNEHLLSQFPDSAQKIVENELKLQGIEIKLSSPVTRVDNKKVYSNQTLIGEYDSLFIATDASAPPLFKASQLPTDQAGFLKVNSKLQVDQYPEIFAAGDCIHFTPSPLPKAGVFAVREGMILSNNVRKFISRGSKAQLLDYIPQKNFLKLIHLSNSKILASRGNWAMTSPLFWIWKKFIDKKFMKKFGSLPLAMAEAERDHSLVINTCGGCGAKISQSLLSEVIALLQLSYSDVMPKTREDCYPIPATHNESYISVDGLRAFLPDSMLFGQISALHALSDLWVSGMKPISLTVSVGLSHRREAIQKNHLLQVMSGILLVCQKFNIQMSNAHTFENAEDHLSITVVGEKQNHVLRKSGAVIGDLIVMNKQLGSGIALQAMMKGDLSSGQSHQLIDVMTTPNCLPEAILPHLRSATDITGFGFIGHLYELLNGSEASAQIDLKKIAILDGTQELLDRDHKSFLIEENKKSFSPYVSQEIDDVFYDPQTNGPVLGILSADKEDLLGKGWTVIGTITSRSQPRWIQIS